MRATQTPMKALICLLTCLATSPLLADYTFVWSGNDARLTGTFSISDSDWANRGFTNLTAVNFQFHDSQNPGHDIVLHSFLDPNNFGINFGWLTDDGLHFYHDTNIGAEVWFSVAAYQYHSINGNGLASGMHSWSYSEGSLEYFDYSNYSNGIFVVTTTGTWSLLSTNPCRLIRPSNLVVAADIGQCGALVHFALPTSVGECTNPVVTCRPPSGSFFPPGTTTIACSLNGRHTCNFTVTVEDREAPRAGCRPVPPPPGNQIPPARSGPIHDGLYQLLSQDNCDWHPAIYLADSAGSFIAGPFRNGDIVRIVESPGGAPFHQPGPRGIPHIHFNGPALIFAVDASGNVGARVGCNPRVP
jgi:hypothetical protein